MQTKISKKDIVRLKQDVLLSFNTDKCLTKDKDYIVRKRVYDYVSGTLSGDGHYAGSLPHREEDKKWLLIRSVDNADYGGFVTIDDVILVKKYQPATIRKQVIAKCECGKLITLELKNRYFSGVCRYCNKRTSIKKENINSVIKKMGINLVTGK